MALCAVEGAKVFDKWYESVDTLKEGMLSTSLINVFNTLQNFTSISKLYSINISFFFCIYILHIPKWRSNNPPVTKTKWFSTHRLQNLIKVQNILIIPYMFPSLYFCHICMKKVVNKKFFEFGVFPKREEKSTKISVGLLLILLFGPLSMFPSNYLSVY